MLFCQTGNIEVNSLTVPTTATVCYWYIPRAINVVNNRHCGTQNEFEFRSTVSTGKYHGDLYAGAGAAMTTGPVIGTRVHLAHTGTVNGTTRSYLNGIEEVNTGPEPTTPTSPNNWEIGNRHPLTAAEAAQGDFEDVRIYNRILTAGEIKTIFTANGKDGIINGLLNRWIILTLGDSSEIGSATFYDEAPSKKNMTKEIYAPDRTAYFKPGFISPRRMV